MPVLSAHFAEGCRLLLGPLRLSLRAGFLEKREKGRTPSYFRFMFKDKPGVYFPVKVAHPAAGAADTVISSASL